MHALGMASDYLRWTATTSSFVVGMRQGQTNIFLLPSSERESDGKISQEKFTSKKKKKTVSSTRYEQNPSPGIIAEIKAATHSLRNGTAGTSGDNGSAVCQL